NRVLGTYAREKNIGWRVDYFIVSERLKDYLIDSQIHSEVMGSDHCPVVLIVKEDLIK
ncbi:MAG: exodeoxyribonuclease, partial [Clostridiales bacterium]|nr:exodeoxyribonuclease [Clostridiales bacterium]